MEGQAHATEVSDQMCIGGKREGAVRIEVQTFRRLQTRQVERHLNDNAEGFEGLEGWIVECCG